MDRLDFLKLAPLASIAALFKLKKKKPKKKEPVIIIAAPDEKSARVYLHTQYGLGFEVSDQIIEDDLYKVYNWPAVRRIRP